MTSSSPVYRCPPQPLDAAKLCDAVRRMLATSAGTATSLVIDLRQVTTMDAAGLAAIYTSIHAASMVGTHLVVEGVTPELCAQLQRAGLAHAAQSICEASRDGSHAAPTRLPDGPPVGSPTGPSSPRSRQALGGAG